MTISLTLPDQLLAAVDAFAADQAAGWSRQDAIKALVVGRLSTLGYLGHVVEEGMRPEDLNAENDG